MNPVVRYVGYGAIFTGSVVLGLYLSFPWDAVKDRLFALAEQQSGVKLAARSLEPSWFTGVEAKDLAITLQGKTEPSMRFEEATVRVSLLALVTGKLGVILKAPLGKGSLYAQVKNGSEKLDVQVELDKVQLDLVPIIQDSLGIPLTGKADLDVDLTIGKKEPKLTKGTLQLKTEKLAIEKGGKIGPLPLPALEIGNIDLKVPVDEGKATFKNTRVKGTDVELALDGTFSPMVPWERSQVALTLGLKPTEKLLDADPLLRPLLNNFAHVKDGEGFYGINIAGSVKGARVVPQRRS